VIPAIVVDHCGRYDGRNVNGFPGQPGSHPAFIATLGMMFVIAGFT
jgi:ribose/xylose/arabinose/galactoside ABC-type transport system permease subunit